MNVEYLSSLLSWERGLKLKFKVGFYGRLFSLLSWERGLKLYRLICLTGELYWRSSRGSVD